VQVIVEYRESAGRERVVHHRQQRFPRGEVRGEKQTMMIVQVMSRMATVMRVVMACQLRILRLLRARVGDG
jgi:hypothetical protein